jgi:hypothetical protein
MITKSYIEGLKQRVGLVKLSANELIDSASKEEVIFAFHVRNLLDYLEGLDAFIDHRTTCETCGRPLYVLKDGSLKCVEMHH